MSGRLFVVATPIGNLEDLTLRAIRVLKEADAVLSEDTRRTKTLLAHLGLSTRLVSVHAHTGESKLDALADELAQGKRYALVTDAGTPLVSDPGFALIERSLARGVEVEAVPGPSAVLAALCVSGLPIDHFRFVGFIPRAGKRRREALDAIARDRGASVLFEAPPRLPGTLEELRAVCGPTRRASVCRELTKLHEQVVRGTLDELCAAFSEPPRGEITVVIAGAPEVAAERAVSDEELDQRIDLELSSGRHAKEVARELAEALGLSTRDVYQRVLARKA